MLMFRVGAELTGHSSSLQHSVGQSLSVVAGSVVVGGSVGGAVDAVVVVAVVVVVLFLVVVVVVGVGVAVVVGVGGFVVGCCGSTQLPLRSQVSPS